MCKRIKCASDLKGEQVTHTTNFNQEVTWPTLKTSRTLNLGMMTRSIQVNKLKGIVYMFQPMWDSQVFVRTYGVVWTGWYTLAKVYPNLRSHHSASPLLTVRLCQESIRNKVILKDKRKRKKQTIRHKLSVSVHSFRILVVSLCRRNISRKLTTSPSTHVYRLHVSR